MIKNIVTVCFLTCLVLPAIAYYGPSTFYNVVLNDRQQIYSRSDLEDAAQARENVLNLIRRNIDPHDYWSGRWFPDRVTESNENSDVSTRVVKPIIHDPDDFWSGRWFPERVTESNEYSDVSTRVVKPIIHDPEESWPGRWFPERVTESPENTKKLQTSSVVNSKKHDPPESWTGKWLPERVTEAPPVNNKAPSQNHDTQRMLNDINAKCDDATNLFVDWDESPINYTCFNQGGIFMPDLSVSTIIRQQLIPLEYHARHVCMDSEIHYDSLPPTFGPHRPAWAKYGEYKFLPMQRWVHNLEPLALVTWGWMMLMPDVNPNRVIEFIKDKALNGPEHLLADGQYDHLLLQHARVVSTRADEIICPRESF